MGKQSQKITVRDIYRNRFRKALGLDRLEATKERSRKKRRK